MPKSAWVEVAPGRRRLIPDIDAYLAKHEKKRQARSDLPTPNVIKDSIDPIVSHADGRMYDSMSAYKNGIKEVNQRTGKTLEIVGDDAGYLAPKSREWKPDPGLKQDIKNAYDKVVGV